MVNSHQSLQHGQVVSCKEEERKPSVQLHEEGQGGEDERRGGTGQRKRNLKTEVGFFTPTKRRNVSLSPYKGSPFKKLSGSPFKTRSPRNCKAVCCLCKNVFANKQERAKHVADVHNRVSHICPKCGKSFKSKKSMLAHKKMHENNCCKTCHKLFETVEQLKEHKKKVHGVLYVCVTCGSCFTRAHDLKRHNETQHQEKVFCEVCKQKVSPPLEKHNKKYHPEVHVEMLKGQSKK